MYFLPIVLQFYTDLPSPPIDDWEPYMGMSFFKKKPEQTRERQRFINIIYFIDSNRTRFFKVPLMTAYWAAGLAIFLVLWSCFGTGLLIRESWLAREGSGKTRLLLDALFQYQTRYDEVYEKAYAKDAVDQKIATLTKKKKQSLAAKTLPEGSAKPDKQAASDQGATEFPISLENVKSRLRENELQVSFDIRNNTKPNLASGNLWGVAKFVSDADQSISYISSPMNVPMNAKGESPDYKGGYAFSIRYFKARTISFFTPADAKGAFREVRIYLANDQGYKTSIDIPIEAQINKVREPRIKVEPKAISKKVEPATAMPTTQPEPSKSNTTQTEAGNSLDAAPNRAKKSLTKSAETTNTNGNQSEPGKVSPASTPSAVPITQTMGGALDSIDEDHPIDDEQVEENGN